MNIHNLFPIPIGFFNIDKELSKKELDFLLNQETRPNMGNTTSVDNYILENKKIKELREFIQNSIDEYFKTVFVPKNNVKMRITQSWLNYTEPGQYHHKHAHPNSFISCVYYVNANKDTDKIYFYQEGYQQIKLPPSDWNIWNSESWWFSVGSGDLIIFPSSLTHMVETKSGTDTRISLAINTFPVGYVGEETSLTGLHLKE